MAPMAEILLLLASLQLAVAVAAVVMELTEVLVALAVAQEPQALLSPAVLVRLVLRDKAMMVGVTIREGNTATAVAVELLLMVVMALRRLRARAVTVWPVVSADHL
jgi:hypothetical protein